MFELAKIVAARPVDEKPYHCIRYSRFDPHGPLYCVTGDDRDLGAREALKVAFQRHGGHCFHCRKWHAQQPLAASCSRDHVRPTSKGGGHHLHNLVIACADCNKRKGTQSIVAFESVRGEAYLHALQAHLTRCIQALGG